MHRSRALASVATVALVSVAHGASAQTVAPPVFALADTRLACTSAPSAPPVDLACRVTATLEHDGAFHVACDDGTVRTYSCAGVQSPRVVSRREVTGRVASFFVRDDRVWVELARLEALPLAQTPRIESESAPAPAPSSTSTSTSLAPVVIVAPPAPAAAPPPPAAMALATAPDGTTAIRAHVVRISGTDAILDAGFDEGVRAEMRIEVGEASEHARDALGLEIPRSAIGRVVGVTPHESRVEFVLGEPIHVGDAATSTDERTTGSMVVPERLAGIFRAQVSARPALVSPGAAFGLLTDVSLEYHFHAPVTLRAVLLPFGFVAGHDPSASYASGARADVRASVSASAVIEFDTRYFAIGIGAGYASVPKERFDFVTGASTIVASGLFALGFTARLGATDGLNLSSHVLMGLFDSAWVFAGLHMTAQIPVERRYAIVLHSGAAPGTFTGIEHFVAEVGFRMLVQGHGGRGSIFVTPLIGALAVAESNVGPMIGLSMDARY